MYNFCVEKIGKHIFDLYIFLNIHVALSIGLMYFIFNQSNFQFTYFLFLIFSTIFSYGMIRVIFLDSNRDIFLRYFYKYKPLFIISFLVSFVCTLYYFFQLPISIRFSLIPLGIITFFYQSNFSFFSFRQNGILKILTVAFVWAMLIVVIPGLYFSSEHEDLKLRFLFTFLYVFLLTLSFDQRDIFIDQRNLGTLPQLFPQYKKSFYLLIWLILSLLIFYIFNGIERLIAEFVLLFTVLLSWFSDDKKSFYYTSFLIEGIPILWGLIILSIKKGLF